MDLGPIRRFARDLTGALTPVQILASVGGATLSALIGRWAGKRWKSAATGTGVGLLSAACLLAAGLCFWRSDASTASRPSRRPEKGSQPPEESAGSTRKSDQRAEPS